MRAPYSREKCGILRLLYENAHVKPDLEGTIDALEIAFEANNLFKKSKNDNFFGKLMHETWIAKRKIHKIVSNKKIDDLHLINSSQMEGIIKEKCNFHIDEIKATIEKISTLDNLLNNSNFNIQPFSNILFLIS